jgi:hypothetical protein
VFGRRRRAKSAAIRAFQTAGPSAPWLFLAAGFSVVVMVVATLWWDPLVHGHLWFVIAWVPAIAFLVVGVADRDAILARRAIIHFAYLVRDRAPAGYPRDRDDADRWLKDSANETADDVTRAFVLATADRPAEAVALLDRFDGTSPLELVGVERLRASLAVRAGEAWDPATFERLTNSLPDDDRRWQRLSLAWTIAEADLEHGRPWRSDFVEAVRDLGPWRTPALSWLVILSQQFTFALICIGFVVVWPLVMRL